MAGDNSWHLDKRVPLTLIFAIFLQTVGVFWWASEINSQVKHNTEALTKHEKRPAHDEALAIIIELQADKKYRDVREERIIRLLENIQDSLEED